MYIFPIEKWEYSITSYLRITSEGPPFLQTCQLPPGFSPPFDSRGCHRPKATHRGGGQICTLTFRNQQKTGVYDITIVTLSLHIELQSNETLKTRISLLGGVV